MHVAVSLFHYQCIIRKMEFTASGQNHPDSAGNPRGGWILGGGESPEKIGLSVIREYKGN